MAGIYVHIPFCHAKCAYCDFYSLGSRRRADDFVAAAVREVPARLGEIAGQPVDTVYFGGGTPSSLSERQLAAILEVMPLADARELTIEVNPEDVTAANAEAWRSLGFNRVSMGVQSLCDAELRAVGRRHSAAGAVGDVETLRQAGFSNISLDLIYGLPGQSLDSWERSLDGVLALHPEHLSAYLLSYEPGTPLTRRLDRGLVQEASDELVQEMYNLLCRKTAAAGMEHYEISNFDRPGYRSRHNSAYWDLTPYLGIGPGAHSLGADGIRRFHHPDLEAYLADPADVEAEEESHAERLDDLIIITLRTRGGLDLDLLAPSDRSALLENARPALDAGLLTLTDDRLAIPEHHWLRADALIRPLLFGA